MDPKTLTRLGLSADATPDEYHAALAAEQAKEIAELKASLAASDEGLLNLKAQRDQEIATAKADRIAKLSASAIATGLWEPGSDRAKHFDKLTAHDVDLTEAYVGLLTPQNPVGGAAHAGAEPVPVVQDELGTALNADYTIAPEVMNATKNALAQCGVDAEMLKNYGPEAIRTKQSLNRDYWTQEFMGEA